MDTTNAATSKRRPLLADLVGDPSSSTWQTLVSTAASQALADDWTRAFAPMDTLVLQLRENDTRTALAIDSAAGRLATTLSDRAALIGFALARCWPATPEELDGWAERAREYVGG